MIKKYWEIDLFAYGGDYIKTVYIDAPDQVQACEIAESICDCLPLATGRRIRGVPVDVQKSDDIADIIATLLVLTSFTLLVWLAIVILS